MQAKTTAQVLKAIACKHLELVRVVGHGYWYFKYDDGHSYETESVFTPRLSDMTVQQWADIGSAFVAQVEERYK